MSVRVPSGTARVALSGDTFKYRKDLKRQAYWEASNKRWTIAASVWNLIKKDYPGVQAVEISKS